MLRKLLVLFILYCFISVNCVYALTLTKEKETIKEIQLVHNSMWNYTRHLENPKFNFKISQYKLKNNKKDTYQIIKITGLNNDKNKKNYELVKKEVFRFDTGISLMFTIVCPLVACYSVPMLLYDVAMSPVNITKNIKQNKQAKKYTKNIIGTEINPNEKLEFYTLQDLDNKKEDVKIFLLNKRTKEITELSGEIKAKKIKTIKKKIKISKEIKKYN